MIRKDKPAGWDPVTDAASAEETLIYQVALTGAAFEADNRTVFTKIMEVTVGETAYEWIRRFEETKDGRGAMAALRLHCEGRDFTETVKSKSPHRQSGIAHPPQLRPRGQFP